MDIDWGLVLELFGLALLAAVLAGAICPLVGCFLLVRRTSFYGIALPQFAAAGVAFGFVLMPWWIDHIGLGGLDLATAMEDTHATINYHLAWAGVFTFGALGALVGLGRRGGSEVARVAAAFSIASAATILFVHHSPTGEIFVHELLRGEILAIGPHELETIGGILGLTLLCVVLYHRDLLITSYDRESARVLGKRVVVFELLLMTLTGATVAGGTLTVGPVVLFGLLVLPPIAGRLLARSMLSFLVLSSVVGLVSALVGIVFSFLFDWPLGPSVVAAAALAVLSSWAIARISGRT